MSMSRLYNNALLRWLNTAILGREYDEAIFHARGARVRTVLQKRLAIGIFLSVFLLATLIYLPFNPLLIIIVGFVPFVISYYIPVLVMKNHVIKRRANLERVIPLLKLIIKFLWNIADNEHDVQKIFLDTLRHISLDGSGSQFNSLVHKMILGMPIKQILAGFDSPSQKLNTFLQNCSDIQALSFLVKDHDTYSQYKVFLKTLESRMVILVAEAIFLPILVALVFTFQNTDPTLHVFFIIIHVVILKFLSRFLLNTEFSLLYSVGLFQGKLNHVFDEFLSFLFYLGHEFQYHPPEMALKLSLARGSSGLLDLLGVRVRERTQMVDFHDAIVILSNETSSSVIRVIFILVDKLARYAGVDLARLIIDIALELKNQKEIEEEKINIINAERFKVKILVVCLTLILSIISSLFPLLAHGVVGSDLVQFSIGFSYQLDLSTVFIMINLFYNSTSCYYLMKFTRFPSVHKYVAIISFLFILITMVGIPFFNKFT